MFGSRLLHSGLRICNDLSVLPSPVIPLPAAYCISYIPRSLSHQEFIIIPKYSMGYEIFTHKAPDDEMKHACPQTLAEIILLQEPKGMGLPGLPALLPELRAPRAHTVCPCLVERSRSPPGSLCGHQVSNPPQENKDASAWQGLTEGVAGKLRGACLTSQELRTLEMEAITKLIPPIHKMLQGSAFICLLNSKNKELITLV